MSESPEQIASAARASLRRGDLLAARSLYEQLTSAAPSDPEAWTGLAMARQAMGEEAGVLAALDEALARDPTHLRALILKGDYWARRGDARTAHGFYSAVAAHAPAPESLGLELRGELRRVQRQLAQSRGSVADRLQAAVAAAGYDPARSSPRFTQALDLLLGRKQIFLQSPTAFYYPELPHRQFYERAEFDWLPALEAQTQRLREELLAVVGDQEAFRPYVQSAADLPPRDYRGLLDNPDWSAFFLVRNGQPVPEAIERAPGVMAALADAPLCRAAGFSPSVLFSLLRPGTRIPPHTGMTNARLIVHLPLIAPEGCALRVGNQVRGWREGEALVFDDSIEHEAWNESPELRVVLLFDIWRPEIDAEERGLISALLSAVDRQASG